MGAGHTYEMESMKEKKKTIHPLWIGAGCLMVIGFIFAGYILAGWFIEANAKSHWIVIPPEFAWPPFSPYLLFRFVIGVFVLLLGSAAVTLVYSLVNPIKPGKYDVTDPSIFPPPPKRMKK
jgi:lysylphosphatidylglycerol synthetase-like protein (DUF2156 family)